MYVKIEHFEQDWARESESTQKLMNELTDASLRQPVTDGHRTLGRIAWHIVTAIAEMMPRTGLVIKAVGAEDPVPTSADKIKKAYDAARKELTAQVTGKWNDGKLLEEDEMYGMKWAKGLTLQILLRHEIHHRGQMTVLMRQAGLKVPGVYGPSKDEWSNYGGQPPEV